MSERSKYLTVIVSDPTKEEASALIGHPKMSAASWSHAINDRDAKDAEIAELSARSKAALLTTIGERDEARECVRRLFVALDPAKEFVATFSTALPINRRSNYARGLLQQIDAALAATPEHLR